MYAFTLEPRLDLGLDAWMHRSREILKQPVKDKPDILCSPDRRFARELVVLIGLCKDPQHTDYIFQHGERDVSQVCFPWQRSATSSQAEHRKGLQSSSRCQSTEGGAAGISV